MDESQHFRSHGQAGRSQAMNLKILLPFEIFAEIAAVSRMVVETSEGSLGLLPQRLDCVAALVPGVLTYETAGGDEFFVAVDEGILVKAGSSVMVSARRAVGGDRLDNLRNLVKQEFLKVDADEQNLRSIMSKMETGLLRRLAAFQHE